MGQNDAQTGHGITDASILVLAKFGVINNRFLGKMKTAMTIRQFTKFLGWKRQPYCIFYFLNAASVRAAIFKYFFREM